MSLNPQKFRPSIASIDEVDDRNLKMDDAKQQIEGSETAPLTTNQLKLNIDKTVASKDLEANNEQHDNEAQAETPISGGPGSVNGFRGKRYWSGISFTRHIHCHLFISTSYIMHY